MLITVFTPAYNRANLLPRLYESLCRQTAKNFEWIVVDDASSDNTEELFKEYLSKEHDFPIYYLKQEHGGKHRAVNKGVNMANGEYFFIVDSDDYLTDDAIEYVNKWIEETKDRKDLFGVSGYRMHPDGNTVGEFPKIPKDAYVEVSNLKRYKSKLMGDKAEVFKTDILRKHPFPEIPNEYFVTERYCWDAIAGEGYKIRWYNTAIYVCDYQDGGLSASGVNSIPGHIKNYQGYILFMRQSMKLWDFEEAVTIFREYNKTANIMKKPLPIRAKDIDMTVIGYLTYLIVKMPIGYFIRLSRRFLNK